MRFVLILCLIALASCSEVNNSKIGIGKLEYETYNHGDANLEREMREAEREFFFLKWSGKF